MRWLYCFAVLSLAVTTHAAPHQIKLLNLLNDADVRSLFEVDSIVDVPEFDLASPGQVTRAARSLRPMHHYRRRSVRSAELRDVDPYPQTTELAFTAFGIDFHLNLTKNSFIAPGMVVRDGVNGDQIDLVDSCYYHGNLIGNEQPNFVTVSTCDGLNGLVRTADHSYTIKQLPPSLAPQFVTEYGDFPHIVYRRSAKSGKQTDMTSRVKRGLVELDEVEKLTIELVVMVDSTVHEFFHDSRSFVLNFVNALDLLMRNPGFGAYNLNLKLLAIHYIYDDMFEDPEQVTSQSYQCTGNKQGEPCLGQLKLIKDLWNKTNIYDADHGLYLTKRNLCFDGATGCKQSGYAPMGGMCEGISSLSVAKADGLQATSEEAHEIGHNLGIWHDGAEKSGGCSDSMNIMSVSQTGTVGNDFTWSTCSAKQLADKIRKGKMACLFNDDRDYEPVRSDFPGMHLSYTDQCQMLYGPQDGTCDQNIKAKFSCNTIYCRDAGKCRSNYPPAEGTPCNTEGNDGNEEYDGWCRIGECLPAGDDPKEEHGNWRDWDEGDCSVTCGGGIKEFTRSCDVRDGERYCKGSDTKYEICNTELCDGECSDITAVNFRNKYCDANDAKFKSDVCKLYCGNIENGIVPDGGRQTDKPGQRADLDICLSGEPYTIGCDGSITSGLTYDNCGVCGGNNACRPIQDTIDELQDEDKTLLLVASLEVGSTRISIKESEYVKSAYFVLRKSDGTYLTSDYTVKPATGTTRYAIDCSTIFTHSNPSLKTEEIVAEGPISESIDVLYYVKKADKFKPISFSYYTPDGAASDGNDHQYANDFANKDDNDVADVVETGEDPVDEEQTADAVETTGEGETEEDEPVDEEQTEVVETGGEGETGEEETGGANTEDEPDEEQTGDVETAGEGETEKEETDGAENTEDEPVDEEQTGDVETAGEGETGDQEETDGANTEDVPGEGQATEVDESQDNNDVTCNKMAYVGGMIENQKQCTAKNGKWGADDWVYMLRAKDSCSILNCKSEEGGTTKKFNGVEDGSWCSKDVIMPKRCNDGKCVTAFCNEDGSKFDNCGICGGNNSTCELVTGKVLLSDKVNIKLPMGATYIFVVETHTKGAKGSYILQTSSGSYLTGTNDSDYVSSDKQTPHFYELGCTAFEHYKNRNEPETLKSDSQTLSEDVELKYDYVDQPDDRYLEYKYYIPN